MKLHYPGDCPWIDGRVVGPTTYGELLVIHDVVYDPATDRTTAELTYASMDDVEREAQRG